MQDRPAKTHGAYALSVEIAPVRDQCAIGAILSIQKASPRGGIFIWSKKSGPGKLTFTPKKTIRRNTTVTADKPGDYMVHVTHAFGGSTSFDVSNKFALVEVRVEPKNGSFPKCSCSGVTPSDFVVDTHPRGYEGRVTLLYDEIADEGSGRAVTKTCEAEFGGIIADTCEYELIRNRQWNASWSDVETKLRRTLKHFGRHKRVFAQQTRWTDLLGRTHDAYLFVGERYKYEFAGAESAGEYPHLGIDECSEATIQSNFDITYQCLGFGVTSAWSKSKTNRYDYSAGDRDNPDGRWWQIRGYQKHYKVNWHKEDVVYWPFRDSTSWSGDEGWQPLKAFAPGKRFQCPPKD
jgi:hypothetical protein